MTIDKQGVLCYNFRMICFVVALKKEAQFFLKDVKNLKSFFVADKPAYSFNFLGKDCVLALSGIGKVSAGLTTQLLIDKYSPELIVNFGSAGGMTNDLNVLDYCIIDEACQYDFDVSTLDDVPIGYIQEYDTVFFPTAMVNGTSLTTKKVASGDRFNNDVNDINQIIKMGASIRDMEGGAVAQVCKSNNQPLVMIKGITDVYGKASAEMQYFENLEIVCKGFTQVLTEVIEKYFATL